MYFIIKQKFSAFLNYLKNDVMFVYFVNKDYLPSEFNYLGFDSKHLRSMDVRLLTCCCLTQVNDRQ